MDHFIAPILLFGCMAWVAVKWNRLWPVGVAAGLGVLNIIVRVYVG